MTRWTAKDIAQTLGISLRTWYNWRQWGLVRDPPHRELANCGRGGGGGVRVFWDDADLDRGAAVRDLFRAGLNARQISQKLGPP